MLAKYSGRWDMRDVVRGDTVSAFAITIKDEDTGVPVVPMSVCCQIRNRRKTLMYEYEPYISPDGRVSFEKIDGFHTEGWRAGVYDFDVEYTLQDRTTRTYLVGSLRILEDESRCRT